MITKAVRDTAYELYARGCTRTRQGALYMAEHEPVRAAGVLEAARRDAEMQGTEDRAAIDGPDGWGRADTGQSGKP